MKNHDYNFHKSNENEARIMRTHDEQNMAFSKEKTKQFIFAIDMKIWNESEAKTKTTTKIWNAMPTQK